MFQWSQIYMGKQIIHIWVKIMIQASQQNQSITYLDAHDLYTWAMSKPPPVGGFEWITDFDNWRSTPCILKVDLEYWKELHDDHNNYPLAPQRLLMNRVEKLVPNLYDKERYIVPYKNFKQYLVQSLKMQKSHRDKSFKEKSWLKKCIGLNTNTSAKAKIEFKNDFSKLRSNFDNNNVYFLYCAV